jgi:hypothetical protein
VSPARAVARTLRHSTEHIGSLMRTARLMVHLEQTYYVGALHPSMWRRGFLSERRYSYPGIEDPALPYISDLAAETRLIRINAPTGRRLLGDKNAFADALKARDLQPWAPEVYGTILSGRFRARSPEAVERMRAQEAVVVKPLQSSGGRGVHLVPGARVEETSEPADTGWIVQERLVQHPVLAEISPRSLNTIRVLAVRLPDRGPIVAAAAQRWGTAQSGVVDNVSAGGLCSLVDLETGRYSAAVGSLVGRCRVELERHPETGARIAGVEAPHWQEAKELVLRLMHGFPEVDHVGWDVCLTADGPRVVEGNATVPNPILFQVHGPFLHDPAVRRFYVEHDLLPSRYL